MTVHTDVTRQVRHVKLAICVLIFSMIWSRDVAAQIEASQAGEILAATQDDATIHDLTFIGKSTGWAVGDHGTVWRSTDAGQSWQLTPTLTGLEDYSFRSVCFLTDQVGWIVGGTISSLRATPIGIVLLTENGGRSWSVLANPRVPYLKHVQFFDLEHGIVVGERSLAAPAGIMTTSDGGRSWSPVVSESNSAWTAGTFLDSAHGFVIGDHGTQATLANGRLLPYDTTRSELHGFHDVSLSRSGEAWIVGDGGRILFSHNQGATWALPEHRFPESFGDFTDFQAVAEVDGNVWIAGSPGSVIFHTTDQGRSWTTQPTGDPSPLKTIHFSNNQHGVAAGEFGRICVTDDGGTTWRNVHGGDRRVATLCVHSRPEQTAVEYLNKWSRESGYRAAVSILTRQDFGADAHASAGEDLRLQHAVSRSGGNAVAMNWRLPVNLPGLHRNHAELLSAWNEIHEQRLQPVVMGHIVAQIRMYRPDVILMDAAGEEDAVAKLAIEIMKQAVDQAADPSRYPEQFQSGLAAWHVKKLAVQRLDGVVGAVRQDGFEILPLSGTTLDSAAQQARTLLGIDHSPSQSDTSYDIVWTSPTWNAGSSSILSDLKIPLNSSARRAVPPLRTSEFETLIEQVAQKRRVSTISRQSIASATHGSELLGQLDNLLKPLDPEHAAEQLAELALLYRENAQWESVEQVYAMLVTEYPDQPAAAQAMLWLVEFWTSSEIRWQRLRAFNGSRTVSPSEASILQASFNSNLETLQSINDNVITADSIRERLQQLKNPEPPDLQQKTVTLGSGLNGLKNGMRVDQQEMHARRWFEMAGRMTDTLMSAYPFLFEDDQIQFVIAALHRQRKQHSEADVIYRRYMQKLNDDDPWHVAAKGEIFLLRPQALSPKPVIECRQTSMAPILDGKLDDPCWTASTETLLGSPDAGSLFIGSSHGSKIRPNYTGPQPMVMWSHDDEYLYLAINVPKHPDVPYAPTQLEGREHDAALGDFDYVAIQLDVDRDYSTYYRFEVDQRGWTRDSCWDDWSYDPQWYVAAEQDERTWSIEAAIPIAELVPPVRIIGETWALGMTRIVPAKAVQSWTQSGGEEPMAPRFGLLYFK